MTDIGFENGPRNLEEMPLLSSEAAIFSETLFKLAKDLLSKCLLCKVGQVSCYFRENIPHIRLAVAESIAFYATLLHLQVFYKKMQLMVNILIKLWRSQCTSNNVHVVLWSVSINMHRNYYFNTAH